MHIACAISPSVSNVLDVVTRDGRTSHVTQLTLVGVSWLMLHEMVEQTMEHNLPYLVHMNFGEIFGKLGVNI